MRGDVPPEKLGAQKEREDTSSPWILTFKTFKKRLIKISLRCHFVTPNRDLKKRNLLTHFPPSIPQLFHDLDIKLTKFHVKKSGGGIRRASRALIDLSPPPGNIISRFCFQIYQIIVFIHSISSSGMLVSSKSFLHDNAYSQNNKAWQ